MISGQPRARPRITCAEAPSSPAGVAGRMACAAQVILGQASSGARCAQTLSADVW